MIIVVNKPYGVLSQFNQNPDYPNQKTLADLGLPPELNPVGRLDMDSEGLLLLSDDKGFEDALMNPKKGHKRCYYAQVDGTPDMGAIELLRGGGIELKGYRTKKCRANVMAEAPSLWERIPAVDPFAAKRSSWMKMELTEGKNRQVRRMTAHVGHPTLRLIRVSIGKFQLAGLALGEWRVISKEERDLLFEA